VFDDIDPRSPIPLYAQIAARLRVAVAADELKAGDLLPSVRQLAATLRVNPATVVQAYRDLEREGFVEMRHGAGTYVQQVGAQMRTQERARQARTLARGMLAEAARLGLSAADLQRALEQESSGENHG
jgi:DNA-binding transcriptional regulator YhcF (GntR family)